MTQNNVKPLKKWIVNFLRHKTSKSSVKEEKKKNKTFDHRPSLNLNKYLRLSTLYKDK